MLHCAGLWLEERPHLADWFARVKARPSFYPALYGFLPASLKELMRQRGEEAWPKVREILKGETP